jgi:hypothetical protein
MPLQRSPLPIESGSGTVVSPSHPEGDGAGRQRVDSRALLRGGRELIIQHGDQEYRLRHTQNDKLILTK